MGGGQQERALKLLHKCAESGSWLCLQNLHLVVAWLPTLEKELSSLKAHESFRLWLTSEPHNEFPTILICQSLKITVEAPPGIKKNMQRTYSSMWTPDFVERGSQRRAQVLFMLSWFHALLQERRNFIPQGWSKFYEFSTGDLRASTAVVDMIMQRDNTKEDMWPAIHGLIENALYGGRVANVFDMRVIRAYLSEFFCEDRLEGRKGNLMGLKLKTPSTANHGEYAAFVARLPDTDIPSMFGLPENIERSTQRAESQRILKDLKNLMLTTDEEVTFDRERWRKQIGPVLEIWKQISSKLDGEKDTENESKIGDDDEESNDPILLFVIREVSVANGLVRRVDTELNALRRVIYGSALLTPAIQNLARSILSDAIPFAWSDIWDGPTNVSAYLRALMSRKMVLSSWTKRAKRGTLLDRPVRMSNLLNPGTFLNAVRQQTARVMKCPLDHLKLISSFSEARVRSESKVVVTMSGLFLQGAILEDDNLADADVNDPELLEIPNCYVGFVEGNDNLTSVGEVSAPLYYTPSREKLLMELRLPSKDRAEKWIMAGVALFLDNR